MLLARDGATTLHALLGAPRAAYLLHLGVQEIRRPGVRGRGVLACRVWSWGGGLRRLPSSSTPLSPFLHCVALRGSGRVMAEFARRRPELLFRQPIYIDGKELGGGNFVLLLFLNTFSDVMEELWFIEYGFH